MSSYRRSTAQGATFFFTLNTFRRQPVLLLDQVRVALREGLKEVRGSKRRVRTAHLDTICALTRPTIKICLAIGVRQRMGPRFSSP